jgi:hypothetical protein
MTVAFILESEEETAEQYDACVKLANLGGKPPPGAQLQAAGPIPGGWRTLAIWESRAIFDAFGESTAKPIRKQLGIREPTIQEFDVTELQAGGGSEAAVACFSRFEGLDADGYRDLDRRTGDAPDGRVLHVAGPTDTGWFVMDLWASEAARDAFVNERLNPAVEAAGIAPPETEDLDLHGTLLDVPSAATA